jgi:hypothetical protein
LPERLIAELEAEGRQRGRSKSQIVRERLARPNGVPRPDALDAIADLIGSVDGLPTDMSDRRKGYLHTTAYGRKRPR